MARTRTPRTGRRRLSRWALIPAVALILGVGFVVTGIGGTPAAQAGFLGICDADTTFPVPADPGGTTDGITYSTVSQTPAAAADDVDPKVYTVVIAATEQNTTLQQFAGGGLHWHAYAMSCMDAQPQIQGLVANWVYELVALWPMRVLGILMQLSFSTVIADALLGATGGLVSTLEASIWTKWSPIIMMAILAVAAIKVARGRGRQGLSSVVWMVGVSVVVTSALTGPGLDLVKSLNDYTRTITSCVTFATTGAGCSVSDSSSASLYADSMVESLASDVWATGALGDLAGDTPADTNGGSWNLTVTSHDGTPDLDDQAEVHIPTAAIPAKVAGSPTWAEVLRWTQTYTNAEVAAMNADPALQCTAAPDQSPSSGEVTNLDDGEGWEPGQLCSYKWLVRSAIVSELYNAHPQAYATFRGVTQQGWTAAIAGLGLLPLGIGIGVMGFMVFLYQVELVALFVVTPLVGLISLKSANAARKWAEMIGATLVKRIAVGFVLGLTIWLASLANSTFANAISGPDATLAMPRHIIPVAASMLTIGCMVVGFMLLKKVQGILLEGVELPTAPGMADSAMDKGKKLGKKALKLGVGATAGALGAGTGLRMTGAMRGMTRSGALGGTLGRVTRAGDLAGVMRGQQTGRGTNAAAGGRGKPADSGPQTGASRVDAAREALMSSPVFRPAGWADARAAQQQAGRARAAQEARVDELRTGRASGVAAMTQQGVAAGMDPTAAQARATAQWDAQIESELATLRTFEAALTAASGTLAALDDDAHRAAGRVVDAVHQGHDVDAVAVG
ncbi:hypothetical protein, partial [Cellulomonas soli]